MYTIPGDGDVSIDLIYQKDVSRQPVSELYHVDYAAARPAFMNTRPWDEAHFYAECSNKGECDPIQGVCNCYPGYDGSSCNRNTCPNDCSGHGTCKNYEGSSYAAWDIEATTYCDCDARWTGPSCSLRQCKTGVDPVETANVDTSRMQRVAFKTLGPLAWDDSDFDMGAYPFGDVYFTFTATDEYGDEWTTELMTVKYDAFYAESEDVAQTFFMPRLLSTWETVGKQARRHVSQTVEDALEALPHNCMGDVTVSEIYTMPGVLGLDDEFDAFVFYDTNYTDLACGLTDIYDQTSTRSIVGCGLPTVDQYLGISSGNSRNGQLDIVEYQQNGVSYLMLVGTGDLYNPAEHDSPIVVDAAFGDIQPGDITVAQGHVNVGKLGTDYFSTGYAYYMYPHYNNDDAAEIRFPLFADPLVSTSEWYSEEYASFLLFDFDANVADLTDAATDYLAGLSLFIRFEKPTVQTLLRVDYFFANEHVLLFAGFNTDVSASMTANLAREEYRNVVGTTQEGCTSTLCANDYELVAVHDIGAHRVWDITYHGLQKNFLGDGNLGSDAELHECSKRGICDFENGLCSCFQGYAGLNCGNVSALAYGI